MKRLDPCSPGIFWLWNSDPSEKEIRRQIRAFAEAGFRSVYLHPMPETFSPDGMKMKYLGRKYFRLFGVALDACRENGVFLMIYDEGGWPSGSVCKELLKKYPELGGQYIARDDDGKVWECTSQWIVDLMNPEATRQFIRMTHEKYAAHFGHEFGRTIRGVFTDEPFWEASSGVLEIRVGPHIEKTAEQLYGCDFQKDILPYLFKNVPESPERELARARYYTINSMLVRENYSRIVRDWCDAHGLDFEGHLDAEDMLFRSAAFGDPLEIMDPFKVPGVDAIWRQVYPGGGSGIFGKNASSLAIRNRLKTALCECFSIYGYGLTAEKMHHIANDLMIRGINRFIVMGSPTSVRGRHKLLGATDYSPRAPIWHGMPALTAYWRWACDFHTGALEAPVWILTEPEKPFPEDRYHPPADCAAAGDRIDRICAELDDAGIFWRFANMTDLRRGRRPKVLLVPNQPRDGIKKDLLEKFLRDGSVRISVEDKKALAQIGITEGNGCRILPCKRADGGSLMIFNPGLKPTVFRFRANGKHWRETLPPDSAPAQVYPVRTDRRGIVSVPLAPGELRILKTVKTAFEPVLLTARRLVPLHWRVSALDRMVMHPGPETCLKHRKADCPLPESGLYTDLDPDFSGILTLECTLTLPAPVSGFLEFGSVFHAGELSVNGKNCGLRAFAPWVYEVSLKKGRNRLVFRISSSGGNEWRRCFREELEPRGWTNESLELVESFPVDDADCGVAGPVRLWTARPD